MLPFCQLRTARWLAIAEHSSAHKTIYCPTNIEFIDLQQDTLLYDWKQQTAVAKQQIQITKEICQEQENAKATLSTSIYTYSIKQKRRWL